MILKKGTHNLQNRPDRKDSIIIIVNYKNIDVCSFVEEVNGI